MEATQKCVCWFVFIHSLVFNPILADTKADQANNSTTNVNQSQSPQTATTVATLDPIPVPLPMTTVKDLYVTPKVSDTLKNVDCFDLMVITASSDDTAEAKKMCDCWQTQVQTPKAFPKCCFDWGMTWIGQIKPIFVQNVTEQEVKEHILKITPTMKKAKKTFETCLHLAYRKMFPSGCEKGVHGNAKISMISLTATIVYRYVF